MTTKVRGLFQNYLFSKICPKKLILLNSLFLVNLSTKKLTYSIINSYGIKSCIEIECFKILDFKVQMSKSFIISRFETGSLTVFHVIKWAFWYNLCTSALRHPILKLSN